MRARLGRGIAPITLQNAQRRKCSRHKLPASRLFSSCDAHNARSKVAGSRRNRSLSVDLVFILALVVLYAVTHWLVLAIVRLGRIE